jgi:hypothetical protein
VYIFPQYVKKFPFILKDSVHYNGHKKSDNLSYPCPDQSSPHYNTHYVPDIATSTLYDDIFSYLEENTHGSK